MHCVKLDVLNNFEKSRMIFFRETNFIKNCLLLRESVASRSFWSLQFHFKLRCLLSTATSETVFCRHETLQITKDIRDTLDGKNLFFFFSFLMENQVKQ